MRCRKRPAVNHHVRAENEDTMQHTPAYLPKAIHDIAFIADEGRLSDLQFAFHDVCRSAGGLPHEGEGHKTVNHLEANAVVTGAKWPVWLRTFSESHGRLWSKSPSMC